MNLFRRHICSFIATGCALSLTLATLAGADPAVSSQPLQGRPTTPLFDQTAIANATAKGLRAVSEGQPGIASRYFGEALRGDPTQASMMFNVGLAHAKAGHLIAAINWYETALARDPQLANATAIRGEIERLEKQLIGQAKDVMDRAAKGCDALDPKAKPTAALRVAEGYAALGDSESAARYYLIWNPKRDQAGLADDTRTMQLKTMLSGGWGPIDEVLAGLATLAPSPRRTELQADCAKALAESDRIAEATAIARELPEDKQKVAMSYIAEQYRRRGDKIAVAELLPKIDPSYRKRFQAWDVDDLRSAGKLDEAKALAERLEDTDQRRVAFSSLLLPLVRAHRDQDAKSMAKNVLRITDIHPFSETGFFSTHAHEWVPALVALGNYDAAVAHASTASLRGWTLYPAHERGTGREYLFGHILLVAGLRGDWGMAKSIAEAYQRIPTDSDGFRTWCPGWLDWGYALAYAAHGKPASALIHFRKVGARISAEPLNDIVSGFLLAGDEANAEATVWAVNQQQAGDLSHYYLGLDIMGELALIRMRCLRSIADHAKANPVLAQRLLTDASHLPQWTDLSCLTRDDIRTELQLIATALDARGDSAGATATRRLDMGPAVSMWMSSAMDASRPEFNSRGGSMVELESLLKSAITNAQVEDIPMRIAGVSTLIVQEMGHIRALRLKTFPKP